MHFGCDKPLDHPEAWTAWKVEHAWVPRTAGATACPIRRLEADGEARRLLRAYALLVELHAWPGAPGDLSAQGARWSQGVLHIRDTHAGVDAEEADEARRRAEEEARKANSGRGGRP